VVGLGKFFSNLAILQAWHFVEAFRMAKFYAATLHDTVLAGADFFYADYREADLDHVDLTYARLLNANFENAVIANSRV
jgi:uncharacterized protein YjbI with pentapeptide repeats